MQTPPAQAQPGATQPGADATPGAAPASGAAQSEPGVPAAPGAQQAPPLQETIQAGERDFNAGKYAVAQGEFQDVMHYYPLDDLTGTAEFYLGEIAYQQKDYATAIVDYNAGSGRLQRQRQGPGGATAQGIFPAATEQERAGIHELRLLIQRHPQTPEAAQARTKLKSLNVSSATR